MKTNVKTKEALQVVSNTLNEAQILLAFDLEVLPHRAELSVITEEKEVLFTCVEPSRMGSFLEKLKVLSPYHKDDIDEILSQLA